MVTLCPIRMLMPTQHSIPHCPLPTPLPTPPTPLTPTAVAVLTVDRLGRRPLLLAGVSGMVAALIALSLSTGSLEAAAAHATATAVNPMLATVSVIALLLYVGCYQVRFFFGEFLFIR